MRSQAAVRLVEKLNDALRFALILFPGPDWDFGLLVAAICVVGYMFYRFGGLI